MNSAFKDRLSKWIRKTKESFNLTFKSILKTEERNYSKTPLVKKVETASQSQIHLEHKVSQHEVDAFRMKAIVLLKKDEMVGVSLQNLLKAPIEVSVDKAMNDKIVIQLSQAFTWSGKTYQFQGKFIKDPAKTTISIPIPESFKIKPLA